MSRSGSVRGSDYRTMFRIIGELADLAPDPTLRRTHAIDRLAETVGASAAFFSETGLVGRTYTFFQPITAGLEQLGGGLPGYLRGETPVDPCGPAMDARTPARSDAALRRELMPDQAWYASRHYQSVRAPARLDDAVYARVTHPGARRTFGLCLLRPAGDRPFGPREREILRAFNDAAHPLYLLTHTSPPDPLDGLPPRLRRVAECLLRGLTIKDTAAELGLSPATVMDYTKPLYRALGVRSQPELLARVLPHRRPPA